MFYLQEPYQTILLKDEVTGLDFSVAYLISEEETPISDAIQTVIYGVTVQMQRNGKIEEAKAKGICTTRTEAEKFVERLARNGVTPTTFLDIVDDSFALPVKREERSTIAQPART